MFCNVSPKLQIRCCLAESKYFRYLFLFLDPDAAGKTTVKDELPENTWRGAIVMSQGFSSGWTLCPLRSLGLTASMSHSLLYPRNLVCAVFLVANKLSFLLKA